MGHRDFYGPGSSVLWGSSHEITENSNSATLGNSGAENSAGRLGLRRPFFFEKSDSPRLACEPWCWVICKATYEWVINIGRLNVGLHIPAPWGTHLGVLRNIDLLSNNNSAIFSAIPRLQVHTSSGQNMIYWVLVIPTLDSAQPYWFGDDPPLLWEHEDIFCATMDGNGTHGEPWWTKELTVTRHTKEKVGQLLVGYSWYSMIFYSCV